MKPAGNSHTVGASGMVRAGVGLILLIVAVTAAFAPIIDAPFLNWDDDRNIVTNPAFRGLGIDTFRWAWQTYHLGVWQPVSWILFAAQWNVGGLSPRTYHLTSIAFHIVNCVLLYLLIVRLILLRSARPDTGVQPCPDDSTRFGAAAATILFAVYPMRVEPVAWISSQPYLPSAMFYLLALLAYLNAASAPSCARRCYLAWMGITLACFMLAVGSKAIAVSLPVVLIILDVWVLRRTGARSQEVDSPPMRRFPTGIGRIAEKLPFVLVLIPVCMWAIAAKDHSASRVPWSEFELGPRLAQSAAGLVFYLQKSILPIGLSPYYRIPPDIHLTAAPYAACLTAVTALTVVLIALRRRRPMLLAAWLAYVAILLPNLGIVQISQQLAADRYGYLGLMPLTVLFAALLSAIWRKAHAAGGASRLIAASAIIGATMACVFATRAYAAHWTGSERLWQRVLALDPDCAVAHCNLGEALIRVEHYAEASHHLSRAIDLEPDFSFAYVNFAALLLMAERFEDAARAGEHAIVAHPPLTGLDLAKAHAICGEANAALRRYEAAWRHTLRAKELGFADAEKMLEYLREVSDEPPG